MKYLFENKQLLLIYGFFLFLGLLSIASRFFSFSPFWATIILFGMIFIPGFALARILKFEFSGMVEKIILWMSFGWVFVLFLSFMAMISRININQLTLIYILTSFGLFLLAFYLDINRKSVFKLVDIKNIFKIQNLPFILVFIFLSLILFFISVKGALFKGGDTLYHLSLLQKVTSGGALTIQNLSYVRDVPNVAYIFPLWHIIMGIATKIAGANMFMIYGEMVLPLSMMVMVTWYWLFKLILPYKSMALIVLIFFVFLFFNQDFGYIFSTLSIPHSLTEFLFLPLLVGLAYNYFFNEKATKMYLILIPLLAIMAACVHMTLFFYFIFVLIGGIGLYGLLCFKDDNFKAIFKKMLIILGLNLGLIAILALIIELKTQNLTQTLASFQVDSYPTELNHDTFQTMNIYVKYAFLCLPLIFVFAKNYRKLLIILAIFLVFLLAYSPFIHTYLIKMIGYIFMKRLYTNILWYWLSIGTVIGLIGLIIDRFINLLGLKWRRVYEIILIFTVLGFVWMQYKYQAVSNIFNHISSDQTNNWLNQNINWLIVVLGILAILIYTIQILKPKFANIFKIKDFQSSVLLTCVIFVCFLILFSPNIERATKILKNQNISIIFKPSIVTAERYSLNYIGGQEALDFIKANIPAKSIFNTYGGFFYLPTVADVHMTSYNSKADQAYSAIYKSDAEMPINQKIAMINSVKAQYLLVNASPAKSITIQQNLDAFPRYFEKVYNKKVVIYKINLENIQKDLP